MDAKPLSSLKGSIKPIGSMQGLSKALGVSLSNFELHFSYQSPSDLSACRTNINPMVAFEIYSSPTH